jgi:hypothetical protein
MFVAMVTELVEVGRSPLRQAQLPPGIKMSHITASPGIENRIKNVFREASSVKSGESN